MMGAWYQKHWMHAFRIRIDMRVAEGRYRLVYLLLLVDRELTWAHVDQQKETTA